jgi:cell division protein FtsA
MPKNDRYVVGLDIGTHKICCVVAEARDDGKLDVSGVGITPSRGIRKGVVVNLDATVDAIKASVESAELAAGVEVESATLGVAGAHIRSFNSRGVVTVSGKDRRVTREDVKRVMESARAVSIPAEREILHVLVQEFVLDEQGGIANPVGMSGRRLEANVHIVTAATTATQNLVNCAHRAGIEIRDLVLEQVAVSESVLTQDEKDLGVALIDIGGGTTDLALFERGSIWHTSVLPVGGEHFTNDLAVGLRTPIPDAERLKILQGCALTSLVEDDAPIEVPSVGGRKPRELSRQVLTQILQPRAEELFHLLHDEIGRAGFQKMLNAGVVLTGGGSLLPGIIEVAERAFELPVRRGLPRDVGGPTDTASPSATTGVGLSLWATRNRAERGRREAVSPGVIGRMGGRVRHWLGEMFH